MDTSETYIQMCRQAKEIQGAWNRSPGDFTIYSTSGELLIYNRETSLPEYSICYAKNGGQSRILTKSEWDKEKHVWLPRIDQLIELLGFNSAPIYTFDAIWMIIGSAVVGKNQKRPHVPKEYFVKFDSFEQLFLAVVMIDRWFKIWNGSDWAQEVAP